MSSPSGAAQSSLATIGEVVITRVKKLRVTAGVWLKGASNQQILCVFFSFAQRNELPVFCQLLLMETSSVLGWVVWPSTAQLTRNFPVLKWIVCHLYLLSLKGHETRRKTTKVPTLLPTSKKILILQIGKLEIPQPFCFVFMFMFYDKMPEVWQEFPVIYFFLLLKEIIFF